MRPMMAGTHVARSFGDVAFDWVILFTGEGVRRLLACAERHGRRDAFVNALAKTRTLTRGPKPVRVLKEIGVAPTLIAQTPTTDGVIASLRTLDLKGRTIGVQLYSDSNPPLLQYLQEAGAKAETVLPYIYAPKSDSGRVLELIGQMAMGKVDAIAFTSSPQVDRLFAIAEEGGQTPLVFQSADEDDGCCRWAARAGESTKAWRGGSSLSGARFRHEESGAILEESVGPLNDVRTYRRQTRRTAVARHPGSARGEDAGDRASAFLAVGSIAGTLGRGSRQAAAVLRVSRATKRRAWRGVSLLPSKPPARTRWKLSAMSRRAVCRFGCEPMNSCGSCANVCEAKHTNRSTSHPWTRRSKPRRRLRSMSGLRRM